MFTKEEIAALNCIFDKFAYKYSMPYTKKELDALRIIKNSVNKNPGIKL